MKKRILSMLLTIAMLLTMAPPVFAGGSEDIGVVSQIGFSAAQYHVSENKGEYTVKVVRRGNSARAVDVAFKAADFTAEYGKDYAVRIDGAELDMVDGIAPEYSEFMATARSASSLIVSEEIEGDVSEEDAAEILKSLSKEAPDSPQIINEEGEVSDAPNIAEQLANEPAEENENAADPEAEANEQSNADKERPSTGLALLDQRAQMLDVPVVNEELLEQQKEEVNEVLTTQNDYFEKARGAFGVLHFDEGQTHKEITVVLLDNNRAEADRVILFGLLGINGDENALLDANPTAFLSIVDDEEYETPVIKADTVEITLDENNPSYMLTLKRTKGLNYYTTVLVSTVDGSAVAGTHYDPFEDVQIAFAPGEAEKQIKVNANKFSDDVYYQLYLVSDGTNVVEDRFIKVNIAKDAMDAKSRAVALRSASTDLSGNKYQTPLFTLLKGNTLLGSSVNNGVAGSETITLTLDDFFDNDHQDLILRHDGGWSQGVDYDIGKTTSGSVTTEVFVWETSKNNSTAVILPKPISTYGVSHFSEPYRLKTVGSGSYWGLIGIGELGTNKCDRDNDYQRNGFDGDDDDGDYVSEIDVTPDYWTEEAYLRGFVKSTSKGDHDPYMYMKNPITLTMNKYEFKDPTSDNTTITPFVYNYVYDFVNGVVDYERDEQGDAIKFELPFVKVVADDEQINSFYPALDSDEDAAAVSFTVTTGPALKWGMEMDYAYIYEKEGSKLYTGGNVSSALIKTLYASKSLGKYDEFMSFLANPAPDSYNEEKTVKVESGKKYALNQGTVKTVGEALGNAGITELKLMPHYTRKSVTLKVYAEDGGKTYINKLYDPAHAKTDANGKIYNEYQLPLGSIIEFDATVGTVGYNFQGYQVTFAGDKESQSERDYDGIFLQTSPDSYEKELTLDATEICIYPVLGEENFIVKYHPAAYMPTGTYAGIVMQNNVDASGATSTDAAVSTTDGALTFPKGSVFMGLRWGLIAFPEALGLTDYYTVWQNGTGDTNGNGKLDPGEYNSNTRSGSYTAIIGNTVFGTLNQINPMWYYSFRKLEGGNTSTLSGVVKKVKGSFYDIAHMKKSDMMLDNNLEPVQGAQITVLNQTAATNSNGEFSLTLPPLPPDGRVSFQIETGGTTGSRTYYDSMLLQNPEIILPAYDTFEPYSITASYPDGKGVNGKNVAVRQGKELNLTIAARVSPNGKYKPTGVKYYLVNKAGNVTDLSKYPAPYTPSIRFDTGSNTGTISLIPMLLQPGDKLYVAFVDSFGKEYASMDTGFVFSQGMNLNTFFFGMIGSTTLESFAQKYQDQILELIGIPTGDIQLGAIGLTESAPVELFDGQTQFTYTAGDLNHTIANFKDRKRKRTTIGGEEKTTDADDLNDALKDKGNGQPGDQDKGKPGYKTKVNFSWYFDIYAAFEFTITQRQHGEDFVYCFESLSLVLGSNMGVSASVTVTLPVGFKAMVGASITGKLTAVYQLQTDYTGDVDHKTEIIYDTEHFSLFTHIPKTSNVGYVFFQPSVKLDLGISWTIFKVTGHATFTFDMSFEFGKNSQGVNYTRNYGDVKINLAYDVKVAFFTVYDGNKDVFTATMFSNDAGKGDIKPEFDSINAGKLYFGEDKDPEDAAAASVNNELQMSKVMMLNAINDAFEADDSPLTLQTVARDYLNTDDSYSVGEDLMLAENGLFAVSKLSNGTKKLYEKKNVYPRSNAKIIDIGDGRLFVLYLDDVASRADYDRTALYYGIIDSSTGLLEAAPERVDTDCEFASLYPSVSELGDGRLAVFWSSADKSLETCKAASGAETLLNVFRSLNLKMRIFDTATESFGRIYDVTETTSEDVAADFGASAVYDAASDKMLVSYTKMDYTSLFSTSDVADAAKCQTVATYRIFDGNSDEFLKYEDIIASRGAIEGKKVDGKIARTIDESNVEQEDANWYGQLFIDTRLNRNSAEFPLVLSTANYYLDGTNAEGVSGRYLAFAYLIDNDRSYDTVDDRDIYLLLCNVNTGEASQYATRVTGKSGTYYQPEFAVRDGHLILLFAAAGDLGNGEDEDMAGIACIDLSQVVKEGGYTSVKNEKGEVLYNKLIAKNPDGKSLPLYPFYSLNTEGMISRYHLSSTSFTTGNVTNSKVWVAWTGIVDKEDGTEEVSDQIYTSVYDLKYTDTDADDPVDVCTWSEPFQITDDESVSYVDCDIAVGGDGNLYIIANNVPAGEEDKDAHTSLVLLKHEQVSKPQMAEEDPLTLSTDYLYAGVPFTLKATARNAGDKAVGSDETTNAEFNFYYKLNGYSGKYPLGTEYYKGQIGAGAYLPCSFNCEGFDADTADKISAFAVSFILDGAVYEAEIEVKHQADMMFSGDLAADVSDYDDTLFDIAAPIRNNGNVDGEEITFAIYDGDTKLSSMVVDYPANSDDTTVLRTKIDDSLYAFTSDGLGYVELTAVLDDAEGNNLTSKEFIIYKQFDAKSIDLSKKISSVSASASVKTDVNEYINITPFVSGANADEYSVAWKSSNTNVVDISADGTPYSRDVNGKAVLTGTIVPNEGNRVVFDAFGMPTKVDKTQFIPDNMMKTFSVEVEVEEGYEPPVDPPYNPPVNPGSSTTKSYTLTFDVNGGNALEQIKAESGTIIDLTKYVPVKAGYEFEGWFSDKALTQGVSSINLKKNTTVYAKWAEKQTVSVPFVDVPNDAYFKDAVYWAVGNGITSGTWVDTFSPYKLCTRAEDITFLYRAAKGAGGHDAKTLYFYDVPAGSYYEDALLWAVGNGVTTGTWEGYFSPDLETSREVFVTMLYRTACLADPNAKKAGEAALAKAKNDPSLRFGDVEAGSYYEEAVYWAKEAGVVSGVGDTMIGDTWVSNAFGLGRIIDRAQIVTMLYRWFGK